MRHCLAFNSATGCSTLNCELCKNNPSRKCTRDTKEKYWIPTTGNTRRDNRGHDTLQARCGADLWVEVAKGQDIQDIPESARVEVCLLDSGRGFKAYLPEERVISNPTDERTKKLLEPTSQVHAKWEFTAYGVRRSFDDRGRVNLGELALTTSSNRHKRRLLIRVVDVTTGMAMPNVQSILSEEFSIVTKDTKGWPAEKEKERQALLAFEPDSRDRIWHNEVMGLIFSCQRGFFSDHKPKAALVTQKQQQGKKTEVVVQVDQLPPDLNTHLPALTLQALDCWKDRGHPGWVVSSELCSTTTAVLIAQNSEKNGSLVRKNQNTYTASTADPTVSTASTASTVSTVSTASTVSTVSTVSTASGGSPAASDATDATGDLMQVIGNASLDEVEHLLNSGADVNAADKKGITALMLASKNGNLDLVKLLVRMGADVTLANRKHVTALKLARKSSKPHVVRFLVENGADKRRCSHCGRLGHDKRICPQSLPVDMLLKAADTLQAEENEELRRCVQALQPLQQHLAAENKDLQRRLMHPFVTAAQEGRLEILQFLVEQGSDINAIDIDDGTTALLHAARAGHLEVVKFLVGKGAQITSHDKDGFTALLHASRAGHTSIVQFLEAQEPAEAKSTTIKRQRLI